VGTKTFAARHEVGALRPAAPASAPSAPASAPSASATIPEVSTRKIESMRPAAVNDVDTAPLETDPRGEPPAPRRGIAIAGVVGACGLAVVAFLLGRAATTAPRPAPAAPQTLVVPPPISHPVDPQPSSAPAPSPPSAAPAATAPTARAQLVLLGDGTLVSVDGVPRGPCPARLTLDPGPHTVVFSFPPTGESKGESLTLRGGEHATLHADFTGASPSIRAQAR
jgi:hypothetical protein